MLFASKGVKLTLNKGYRTTAQISDGANYVLDELGSPNSFCVARDGEQISINYTFEEDMDLQLLYQIEDYLNKGYKTIAIICKDNKETDNVYKQLCDLGVNIHKISEEDQTYEGGLCIMPSYLSKGLEFDGVIVYNANNLNYDNNSEIDMKLLYVAMTRALHELSINYNGELSKPLEKLFKKDKTKVRKK